MQALTSLISYVLLAITPALAQATTPATERNSVALDLQPRPKESNPECQSSRSAVRQNGPLALQELVTRIMASSADVFCWAEVLDAIPY